MDDEADSNGSQGPVLENQYLGRLTVNYAIAPWTARWFGYAPTGLSLQA